MYWVLGCGGRCKEGQGYDCGTPTWHTYQEDGCASHCCKGTKEFVGKFSLYKWSSNEELLVAVLHPIYLSSSCLQFLACCCSLMPHALPSFLECCSCWLCWSSSNGLFWYPQLFLLLWALVAPFIQCPLLCMLG